ncbi:MAG: hypothetical protein AB8B92_02505 [Gammaproteobacteria bacterium]
MSFETLEILALIVIAISAIKLITFFINPQLWYSFIGGLYKSPPLASLIAFILAMIVLYFLLISGVSVVEILAVCLFVMLLIAVGMAKYIDKLIPWVKEKNIVFILKEVWLYTFVWLLLLIWGVGEIFLS